jgi:hypothetical protein
VSLITNPGRFDGRESKTIRYPDEDAGVWKERYVRGRRILPMLLRCWAENEDAAEIEFSVPAALEEKDAPTVKAVEAAIGDGPCAASAVTSGHSEPSLRAISRCYPEPG